MAEMEKSKMEHLIKWFEAKRGRKLRMTEKLDLSTGAISQWKRVPKRHLSMVAKITKIPVRVLSPDLYEV
jgi:hypothetical protein